jgi:hypothetical protein
MSSEGLVPEEQVFLFSQDGAAVAGVAFFFLSRRAQSREKQGVYIHLYYTLRVTLTLVQTVTQTRKKEWTTLLTDACGLVRDSLVANLCAGYQHHKPA